MNIIKAFFRATRWLVDHFFGVFDKIVDQIEKYLDWSARMSDKTWFTVIKVVFLIAFVLAALPLLHFGAASFAGRGGYWGAQETGIMDAFLTFLKVYMWAAIVIAAVTVAFCLLIVVFGLIGRQRDTLRERAAETARLEEETEWFQFLDGHTELHQPEENGNGKP